MLRSLYIWWLKHEAAWHRVDCYLARNRGDMESAIEHASRANACIYKLTALTNRLWS